jgi:hypothetical protein
MTSRFRFEQMIIKIVLLTGVILSLVQFFFNRSLWLDESVMALNIINRSYSALLKPLDYIQVAPILFLQIEKVCSTLIPNSELGLRLFPLISYLLSLIFIYKILKVIHQDHYTIIFSISLFAINATFIYYSNEVRQYMTDVLALASLYYFIFKKYNNERNKYYCLGLVGAINIFLSNVSCIILFAAGLYLLFDIFQNKRKYLLHLMVISMVWASSFLLYYFLFINNHPSRVQQTAIFSNLNVFLPTDPFSIPFYKFLLYIGSVIALSLFRLKIIAEISLFILTFTGIASLIRKKQIGIIILTLTPLIIHLLLSSLRLYPFEEKKILYIFPCIIIICSFGFKYIVKILFVFFKIERSRLLASAIPLLILLHLLYSGFPLTHSEIKKSIKYIEHHMDRSDKVYVNFFATLPYLYYKEISYINMDTNNIIIGQRNENLQNGNNVVYVPDTLKYSNELSHLSGRVWFLFDLNDDKKNKFMKGYFESKGIRPTKEYHTAGSDVYLYEINQ